MPNLSIKDVPESWAEALRLRAVRNHRSLQGELMALVEAAVTTACPSIAPAPSAQPAPAWLAVADVQKGAERAASPAAQGKKNILQVMAHISAQYPEGGSGAPLGRDIIRAERDAR